MVAETGKSDEEFGRSDSDKDALPNQRLQTNIFDLSSYPLCSSGEYASDKGSFKITMVRIMENVLIVDTRARIGPNIKLQPKETVNVLLEPTSSPDKLSRSTEIPRRDY